MIGAAAEVGQGGHRGKGGREEDGREEDLGELFRATEENARHEREGSHRKVMLGRQLFRIKEEKLYLRRGYKDLNAYTDAELKFKEKQAQKYMEVRGLSLELVAGTDIALTKLMEIARQDERVHKGLILAAHEREKVKIEDLRRGAAAGRQVLEAAEEGDEEAGQRAEQRAYEAALERQEAPEVKRAREASKRTLRSAKRTKKLVEDLLRAPGQEEVDPEVREQLDQIMKEMTASYSAWSGETAAEGGASAAEEAGREEEEVSVQEEEVSVQEEEVSVQEEEVSARTEAEEGEEGRREEVEAEEVEVEDEEVEEVEAGASQRTQGSAEAEDPGAAEPYWLRRAVLGAVGVLDDEEKKELSDLLYAGLLGSPVKPVLEFGLPPI